MSEGALPFFPRLWLAWACFFRLLVDEAFALRVRDARQPKAVLPPPPEPEKPAPPKPRAKEKPKEPDVAPALALLSLLQREGRLVDFLEQDITTFQDAEIGAAVRVVHEGCRKALRDHVTIVPLRNEEEGQKVTLEAGFSPAEVKLSGDVKGKPPYRGTLTHRGWKAEGLRLPTKTEGHDPKILAPAEVEL